MLISVLGWIGNILLAYGVWEIGNKRRRAHLITMVGEVAWIWKSVLLAQWDLAIMCVFFTVLAGRCWVKWGTR